DCNIESCPNPVYATNGTGRRATPAADTDHPGSSSELHVAERVGFEPTVPRKRDNRFRVCPDRPLRHLSCRALFYMQVNPSPVNTIQRVTKGKEKDDVAAAFFLLLMESLSDAATV